MQRRRPPVVVGGFYAWLNAERDPGTAARLRRRGLASAEELADQLLRDTGVATLPGDAYGWDKSSWDQVWQEDWEDFGHFGHF